MSIEEDIDCMLREADCSPLTLPRKQVWQWQQKWRERFAAELFLDTGKWILRGLDWHVLAGYDDVCVKERALERYTSIEEGC